MLPLGNNFFSLRAAPFKKFFSDSTTPLMFYKYRLCMYKHIMYERPFIVYLKLYFAVSHSQVGDFFLLYRKLHPNKNSRHIHVYTEPKF